MRRILVDTRPHSSPARERNRLLLPSQEGPITSKRRLSSPPPKSASNVSSGAMLFRPWVALFDERRARHLSTGEQVVEPCGRLERMALRVALCREAHGACEHNSNDRGVTGGLVPVR